VCRYFIIRLGYLECYDRLTVKLTVLGPGAIPSDSKVSGQYMFVPGALCLRVSSPKVEGHIYRLVNASVEPLFLKKTFVLICFSVRSHLFYINV